MVYVLTASILDLQHQPPKVMEAAGMFEAEEDRTLVHGSVR